MADPRTRPECPTRQLICQGGFCAVERCRCGAVYLSVGPVCLRLDASALPELAEVILQASFIVSGGGGEAISGTTPAPGEAAGDRGEAGSGGDPSVEQLSTPTKLN